MSPDLLKRLRLLASALSILLLLAVVAGGVFYFRLRASLPLIDGTAKISGLTSAATIERDALGVPTIRAGNRLDVARALGWAHAQDRFFQMDLLRRTAAGELAELIGSAAVPLDRANRLHGFRARAREQLTHLPANERALVEAYTAGANASLAALGAKPFEYIVLRSAPQPWRLEDSLLVGYAMLLYLQSDVVDHERMLATVREAVGLEALAFFAPASGPRDAALDGSTAPLPPIPSAKAIDLRKPTPAPKAVGKNSFDQTERAAPGSNAFALSGAHTANGAGIVANDMHLNLGVPNTWYRASLVWPDGASERRVTGITLPGTPVVIAGSNGRVAWGFTNSYADTSDLIVVPAGISPDFYRAPGPETSLQIQLRHETIAVRGAEPVEVDYRWTIWGPIVGADVDGHPLAQRWTGHEPGAINFNLLAFENVATVAEAVAAAHRNGTPTLNLVVADLAGEIAWTIVGPLPKRIGFDGQLPVAWTFGDRRWDGLLSPAEMPAVVSPASGRIWSANQRHLGGAAHTALGGGAYEEAMRAAQLRDGLAKLERATPRDLLNVQLDDRALALERWQKLLLDVLSPAVIAEKSKRAELRSLVEKWEGRASVDSVSYHLVRTFRNAVAHRVLDPIFAPAVQADASFTWSRLLYEEPLWAIVQAKPLHLLDPAFASWDALLAAAVDDTVTRIEKQNTSLAHATWGAANTTRIVHPLSRGLPAFLTSWLNLPAEPLPGDRDMPRVQRPRFGASERFVVSPGHESEGIFHMPGGQSGHPLSPYYRAGHAAWARGEPTPFLPGKTEHTLTLQP